jgi:peptidoglycan/xylan/chitin deacetylase (PgdA/CDA1 family)
MSAVVSSLGSRPVAGAAAALTSRRIRAVTYHDVSDPAAFARQLDWIADRYTTVSGQQVAAAVNGGPSLHERAIWLTFDDGDATVIDHGLPLLTERGMVATAFLCGGWIGTDELPWWVVVEAAWAAQLIDPGIERLSALAGAPSDLPTLRLAVKRSNDTVRRAVVTDLEQRLVQRHARPAWRNWSVEDVGRWVAAGNDVGNHSWDHPLIDRCADEAQRMQVRRSHERLSEILGGPLDVFAWPNGNPAAAAADELRRLGYRLVAECDHRLVARRPDAFAMSRLKLDSTVGLPRARAVLSGAHSSVFHLQRRLTRWAERADA